MNATSCCWCHCPETRRISIETSSTNGDRWIFRSECANVLRGWTRRNYTRRIDTIRTKLTFVYTIDKDDPTLRHTKPWQPNADWMRVPRDAATTLLHASSVSLTLAWKPVWKFAQSPLGWRQSTQQYLRATGARSKIHWPLIAANISANFFSNTSIFNNYLFSLYRKL